jgi:lysophospholipase L1-like esterase
MTARRTLSLAAALVLLCDSSLGLSAPITPPLRIMPIGNSITVGSDNYNLTPGGYRTTLYGLLTDADYTFDFVGSQTTNPGPIPDSDHEGHGGYQLNQLQSAMIDPLQHYQPDVVLLLGGTNDVSVSLHIDLTLTAAGIADRLDALLSDLYTYRPNAIVFVGNIPMATLDPVHSARSAEVNALMPAILASHSAQGQDVYPVDVRSVLTPSDYADLLHPNPRGYAKIGQAWFDAIEAVLPPPLPGDVNGDGLVNIFDVNLVSAHWNEAGPDGDANGDGVVNIFDINYISDHWFVGEKPGVPEPSLIILSLEAAIMFCLYQPTGGVR